ncbi:MAG: hypothetical protein HQM13_21385 [SAR324 cluster bacterium]|nr:hypothetical protein [SAR324 cluster bacterium]
MFRDLSIAEIRVFEEIAEGGEPYHDSPIVRTLVKKGLISEFGKEILPVYPPLTITHYQIPIDILFEWCVWDYQNV